MNQQDDDNEAAIPAFNSGGIGLNWVSELKVLFIHFFFGKYANKLCSVGTVSSLVTYN